MEKMLKIDERSLVAKTASGDESAFAELCKEYGPLIKSMSARYAQMSGVTDPEQLREDFSQEATLALFRAAKTYEVRGGEVSFGLYSKICIRNALVSELRRIGRKKKAEFAQKSNADAAEVPRGTYDGDDVSAVLRSGLLSSFEKDVFKMYIDGIKVRDMAKKLNKSPKSVSNAVYRIKTKVRGFLRGSVD